MDWLNYHHLFYFSVIAQEGGIAAAARKLRLTHSTLSAQLRALEEHFGTPLFERRGRRLVPTAFGAEAAGYATDIFRLGRELNEVARGRASPARERLRIGLVASLPKTLTHHLLAPAIDRTERGAVVIRQDSAHVLVDLLITGRLHLVLADHVPPAPPGTRIHAHLLGQTEVLLYARPRLARKASENFPASLSGVPFVLPPTEVPLRRSLDAWFVQHDLRVTVKTEVEDAGLLRVFGSEGRGVFPVRAALRAEVEDLHDVTLCGACSGVRERYYALTTDRRIEHPALKALVEAARKDLKPLMRTRVPRRNGRERKPR
jgi:LysR family transcriptional activator of nhaA